jgi:hypothetical protein
MKLRNCTLIVFFIWGFNALKPFAQTGKQLVWQSPRPTEIAKGSFTTADQELQIELTLTGINNVNPENFIVKTDLREEQLEANNAQTKFNTIPLSTEGYKFQKNITLKAGVQLIHVIYKDVTGSIVAEPLRVRYQQSRRTLDDSNLYVLSIGTATDLRYTVKDACNFGNAFRQQGGDKDFIYKNVFTDMLLCKEATATNIKKKFEKIGETNAFNNGKSINAQDVLIVYLSSHGFREGNDYFIAGSDVDWTAPRSTSVEYKFIIERLAQLPCKKLLFVDACQSQLYQQTYPELGNALKGIISAYKGFTVFTSSSPGEYSGECTEWMNGAFTYALLEGLKGAADAAPRGNENGQISIIELRDYLMGRVPALVHNISGGKDSQNPQLIQNDFGHLEFFLTRHYPKKEAYCPITCESDGRNLIGVKIYDINKEIDHVFTQKLTDELNRQGLRARALDGNGVGNSYVNALIGMTNVVKKREIPIMSDVKTTEYEATLLIQFAGVSNGDAKACTDRTLTVLFKDDSGIMTKIQNKAQGLLLEEFKKLKPLPLCR